MLNHPRRGSVACHGCIAQQCGSVLPASRLSPQVATHLHVLTSTCAQVQYTSAGVGGAEAGGEGEAMVRGLQGTRLAVDEKLERSRIQVGRW